MTSAPDPDLSFMSAFPAPTQEAWRAAVDKVLKGGDFEKRLVARTADGIRIEPLYAAASPPARPLRAQAGRWQVTARLDHPAPAEAQKLALADLEGGANALTIAFAGARAARGYGLVAKDVAALDAALDGAMLDLIQLRLDPAPEGRINALLLAALVEKRGLSPETLSIDFGMDPIGVFASTGGLAASWSEVARRLAATIRALKARGFNGPFVTVDTRPWHEAGASEAQELGYGLASAIAYLRALEAEGFSLEEARDAISFTLVADTDEFLTIAKLRAARLLWARIQGACGLTPAPMVLHAETAWRSLTRRDPWVNLLRGTVATFSAGIGGADGVTVQPFTAALGLADGFARRIARNTQLVLLEEANLWRVADPAAGSGSFEALTQALCEQGWAQMQAVEREAKDGLPGILAALTAGTAQAELERQREARARAIATRREPITGTSEFPNLREAAVAVLDVAPVTTGTSTGRTGTAPDPEALIARLAAGADRQEGLIAPQDGLRAQALPSQRLAEPFEALRDRADAAAVKPVVFQATLGPVADFTARAGFALNLFEAGGLAAPVGDGFAQDGGTDLAALAAAFTASGARLACLCGSDAAYAAEGADAAQALTAAGATVWLAGRPGDLEAALNNAGVRSFIYAGCDAVAVLAEALAISLPILSD
ncbi:MAG: methylmalonyl-CoA mutase subunit beta [Bosea sp. (in: a-proteobacteria)]|uniref:methylmalonyl-CoA mutase subunit beta n=1 Tax=Bosea sp. (in: a-proteobacteria) TaxID=1871050 RepID=UPI0027339C8B|nr:methylmalonyl-CoA mutase subunit beta [Bosea sp. (in: a-proteobacteria)]MDP3599625.1 methylmalonyl-CoA mutase subunit beta [Bosea sp. (in: a-proteobacteria)]